MSGDNWSCKTCRVKMSPPTNQHPVLAISSLQLAMCECAVRYCCYCRPSERWMQRFSGFHRTTSSCLATSMMLPPRYETCGRTSHRLFYVIFFYSYLRSILRQYMCSRYVVFFWWNAIFVVIQFYPRQFCDMGAIFCQLSGLEILWFLKISIRFLNFGLIFCN